MLSTWGRINKARLVLKQPGNGDEARDETVESRYSWPRATRTIVLSQGGEDSIEIVVELAVHRDLP